MPVFGDPVTVHALVPASAASREMSGIRTHRADGHQSVSSDDGLLVTTPAETAVTLARHRHHAVGLAAVDAAMRLGHAMPDELAGINEGRSSSRGRNHARWAIDRASPRRESVLESVSSALIEWLGFPQPELQMLFSQPGDEVDRGDFWWPEQHLLGEADGESKYDGRFGDPASLLRERHSRDRRLRAGIVRAVAHWGWIETAQVVPLRDLLTGHRLPRIAPENTAELHTLRAALNPAER